MATSRRRFGQGSKTRVLLEDFRPGVIAFPGIDVGLAHPAANRLLTDPWCLPIFTQASLKLASFLMWFSPKRIARCFVSSRMRLGIYPFSVRLSKQQQKTEEGSRQGNNVPSRPLSHGHRILSSTARFPRGAGEWLQLDVGVLALAEIFSDGALFTEMRGCRVPRGATRKRGLSTSVGIGSDRDQWIAIPCPPERELSAATTCRWTISVLDVSVADSALKNVISPSDGYLCRSLFPSAC